MTQRPAEMARGGRLAEVVALFLRLGLTAFGGPAAHIGLMHDEVVKRRRWLDDQGFLDLLGATNLIPGPNSTEMAIHIGYLRAGWPGLIAGGAAFILPAMAMVTALAWAYVRYGATPQAAWLLQGIQPVVIAIIVQALWGLGRKAINGAAAFVIAAAVIALYFLGANELLLLAAGGLAMLAWRGLIAPPAMAVVLPATWALPVAAALPFGLPLLFLTFLKIGAVLYGSGYVLIAFLRADFVARLGWLTEAQLLDAVAVGQVTPGPLFTTATFIGYLLGGLPGAVLGTVGIFLPAFVFVAISNPLIPRVRNSPRASAVLDGVNAASLGLMAAVTWQLGRSALRDPLSIAVALAAAALLFRFKVNSFWLVLGGAAVGLARGLILR